MKRALFAASAAVAVALLALPLAGPAWGEDIKLRIASGHPPANTYVSLMQTTGNLWTKDPSR